MPRHLPLLTLLAAAACGTSVSHTVLNPSPRPMAPRPAETVELFTSMPPARPYVDVALIEAEESTSWSTADTGDLLSALRKRGAKLGCDAVVVGGATSRDPQLGELDPSDRPRSRRGYYGTCIVYVGPAPAPAAAAPGAIVAAQ